MSLAQLKASLALWRSRYAYRAARLAFWKRLHNKAGVAKWDKLRLEAKASIHQRLKQIKEAERPREITMYDSVTVSAIPAHAEAVAGYVGGKYQTYGQIVRDFPKAKHLSIAIASNEDAECLDIETGDANPSEAPAWVHRQHLRKVKRPVLYANLSTMPAIKQALQNGNVQRSSVRLWCADWTYKPHIPAGYDACQWTDRALNRNLDCSECSPTFWQ